MLPWPRSLLLKFFLTFWLATLLAFVGVIALLNGLLARDPQARLLPRAGIVHRLDKDTSGLMVVALLGALLVQLGLGLFAADVDSYTFDGPLAKLIDSGLAEQVTEWHEIWFNVLLGLVGVHVLAIVAYRKLKNTNLVPPMITGSKTLVGEVKPLRFAPGWLGLVVLAVAAVLVVGGLSLV